MQNTAAEKSTLLSRHQDNYGWLVAINPDAGEQAQTPDHGDSLW
jgi:hypothetical protein